MSYPFYQQSINPGMYQNPNFQQPQQNIGVVSNPAPTMPKMDVFVPVANEDVAKNYPVGYGNTVIFRDENSPRIYVKAMGYSQLESPIFEKYVRESEKELKSDDVKEKANTLSYDDLKAEIDDIRGQIKGIKDRLSNRNNQNDKRSDK